jgi:hypothetical protein
MQSVRSSYDLEIRTVFGNGNYASVRKVSTFVLLRSFSQREDQSTFFPLDCYGIILKSETSSSEVRAPPTDVSKDDH